MSVATKDGKQAGYREWSTDELQAEADGLAAERTRVREAQNEVAAELEIRRSLQQLSPETRRIVEVRLGGSLAPAGGAEGKK